MIHGSNLLFGLAILAGIAAAGGRGLDGHAAAVPRDAQARVPVTLAATADVNPDADGRPSPIVIHVYQLTTDSAFVHADFSVLFDDGPKALGADVVSRDEQVIGPGESRTVYMTMSAEARFVGVVAAFRDVRNAEWRRLVPGPVKGLTLSVERARLVVYPD